MPKRINDESQPTNIGREEHSIEEQESPEHWSTTDVVPLPAGWVNVIDVDGDYAYLACPAMLRQELDPPSSEAGQPLHATSPPPQRPRVRIVPAIWAYGELHDITVVPEYVDTIHESEKSYRPRPSITRISQKPLSEGSSDDLRPNR